MSTIRKLKNVNIWLEFCVVVLIVALLFNPTKYAAVALEGVVVWATLLLPVLFPFFVLTKLFSGFDVANTLSNGMQKGMKKIFNVSGKASYVFLLGVLSGYPVGSKITADLYESGQLDRGEANRVAALSSNSGPMFIIGTVGSGMMLSFSCGAIILASHILAALANGLIFRNYKAHDTFRSNKSVNLSGNAKVCVGEAMSSSIWAILNVGGYVCLFFVVGEIFQSLMIFQPICSFLGLFGVDSEIVKSILCGGLEITNGCRMLSACSCSLVTKTILGTFIVTFGGLSTLMQAHHFLRNTGLKFSTFAIMKLSHTLLATAISIPLCLIFL